MPVPASGTPTYCPQDAINLAREFAHGIPVASVMANCCDLVHSFIWRRYPWYWSVANFTPINLQDKVQDYNPTDTGILRPLIPRIVRTDVSPVEYRDLMLLSNLSPELTQLGGLDTMKAVGWYPSQNIIRFDKAVSVGTGQTLQFQGIFQKIPPKINENNLQTPLLQPDIYFDVFVEGLKWKIYQLGDDPRAGTIQVNKNGNMMKIYTGQLGVFMEGLLEMARTEDLGSGDEWLYPEQPFGAGRGYNPGLYGL